MERVLPFGRDVGRGKRRRARDEKETFAAVDLVADLLRERQTAVRHALSVVPDVEPRRAQPGVQLADKILIVGPTVREKKLASHSVRTARNICR